jgi:filamentous hemagglutinin
MSLIASSNLRHSRKKALVPQVYVRVKDGDLAPSGALLAGSSINLNLTGDLTNSGTIAGRSIVSLTADNVHNLGGRITGDTVAVTARGDLNNIGGTITAGSALIATAGRDVNLIAGVIANSGQGGNTVIDARRNLNLGVVNIASSSALVRDADN